MKMTNSDSRANALDDDLCIEAELEIVAFLNDILAPERRSWLWQHVMQCASCLQTLVECMADGDDSPGLPRWVVGPLPRAPARDRGGEIDPATSRAPRTRPATGAH